MIPLIILPLGKDLVTSYEFSFGKIQFDLFQDDSGDFEDMRSGWSFSVNCKNSISIHKIIKEDKDVVLKTLKSNSDFMNIITSFIGILVDNIRPSVVHYLEYDKILFSKNNNGPELEITWFQVPEVDRRIDRIYFSIL